MEEDENYAYNMELFYSEHGEDEDLGSPSYTYDKEAILRPWCLSTINTVMECVGWQVMISLSILQIIWTSIHGGITDVMYTSVMRCGKTSCKKRCFISLE